MNKIKNTKNNSRNNKANNSFFAVLIKDHKDSQGGHPHVIVDNYQNKHVSVGITKASHKGKGHPNKRLQTDPLQSGKISYMHKQGTVDLQSKYVRPRNGYMHPDDFIEANNIGKRALEKHKKTRKK